MERLSTGIEDLDWLMRGGLLKGGLHLLTGDPASGKTVLAHQIAAASAARGRVLYLTALVESHGMLQAQASNFDFFDPALVGDRLYYVSVYTAFREGGFEAVQARVLSLVREHDPELVVLDGLHALKSAAKDPALYQRFLSALQTQASTTGVSVVLVSNRSSPDVADAMYTVSDGILILETEPRGPARVRRLEVRKLRTADHVTGRHAYEITSAGIRVYPRVEALVAREEPDVSRVPPEGTHRFGIAGLDQMVGGGLSAGSATLLVGTSGAGKTTLALSYVASGIAEGERVVFMGFHETPDRMLAKAASIGLDLEDAFREDRARAIWHSTAELPADRVAHELLAAVESLDASRVVIDGMDDLKRAVTGDGREVSFISGLLDLLRARGVGVLLTMEVTDLFEVDLTIPLKGVSTSVDNLILVRHQRIDGTLKRSVSVIKVRAHPMDPDRRSFTIGEGGVEVQDTAPDESSASASAVGRGDPAEGRGR